MLLTVNTIEKRLETLRAQVNAHRRQELLMAVPMAWNALCAAMDAVGDVELGIAAFQSGKVPNEIGHTYLATYGLMQMLYVQQDAMNVIRAVVGTETVPASRKALGEAIKSQQDHMLAPIRQRRNRAVGHPMTNDGRASFIVRVSLSARGFTVYSVGDSHEFETQRVDLVADIAAQQRQVAKSLGDLVRRLKTSENAHRRAHRGVKLVALLPETLGYHVEKIAEVATSPGPGREAWALASLQSIHVSISEFRNAVLARAEFGDAVKDTLKELEHPLAELAKALGQGVSDEGTQMPIASLAIYCEFVRTRLKELREIALEIDRDYESDV